MGGNNSDSEGKTTGRWSKNEHELFIEGKIYFCISLSFSGTLTIYIALSLYGKDWKKVETHIGTRSGA